MPLAMSGSSVGELVICGGLLWNPCTTSCAVSRLALDSLVPCAGSLGRRKPSSGRKQRRRSIGKNVIRLSHPAQHPRDRRRLQPTLPRRLSATAPVAPIFHRTVQCAEVATARARRLLSDNQASASLHRPRTAPLAIKPPPRSTRGLRTDARPALTHARSRACLRTRAPWACRSRVSSNSATTWIVCALGAAPVCPRHEPSRLTRPADPDQPSWIPKNPCVVCTVLLPAPLCLRTRRPLLAHRPSGTSLACEPHKALCSSPSCCPTRRKHVKCGLASNRSQWYSRGASTG